MSLKDIDRLRLSVKELDHVTPSIANWGSSAVYGDKTFACTVKGLFPDYEYIEHQDITMGRSINDVDVSEARRFVLLESAYTKVCLNGARILVVSL